MARCPAAKRRDEAVTGSHPFSSKASYRYPRKKTSSGRATRIAWRERREPREETPAPGERGRKWGARAGDNPQDNPDPGEEEDGGDGERSGWTHGRKFPLYPIGRIRSNSSGNRSMVKSGGCMATPSAPSPSGAPAAA